MRNLTFAFAILVVAVLCAGPVLGQGICDQPPSGGDPQILRGALRLTDALDGDFFHCGTVTDPTPGTCELYYRIYTDQESSCINTDLNPAPPAFLPNAYGSTLKNYETEVVVVGDWPSNLGSVGPVPKKWYIVWDHITGGGTADYIGYYAAQSDVVALGEIGNQRLDPCTSGGNGMSCGMLLKATVAHSCLPVNTPVGEIGNLGGLGAVPVPVVLGFVGDAGLGFSDPAGRIALEWVAACAQTQGLNTVGGGMAPEPLMGYRLEVYVDRDGDGVAERATGSGWSPEDRAVGGGCGTGASWEPLLDIAPGWADVYGTRETRSAVVDLVDFTGAGGPLHDPAGIEALTFRLRVLFRDDRFDAFPGGRDLVIHPVCSAPSAQGTTVANPAVFGAAVGAVPDGDVTAGQPLEVSLEPGGDVTLTWGESCNVNDADYAIYEGVLGDFTGHVPRFCSTGGATTKTFTPGAGGTWYVVVPENAQREGSYGLKSGFVERPASAAACRPERSFACQEPLLPPTADTGGVSDLTALSATLLGTVNPNGFLTQAWFEWGESSALGNSTLPALVGDDSVDHSLSFSLNSLSPGMTYHYRVAGSSGIGPAEGSIQTLTTASGLAPTVVTDPATNVAANSATLNGTVNPNGLDTEVHFEWGTNPSLGNVSPVQNVGNGTGDVPVQFELTGLLSSTTYHFRLVGTNSTGTGTGSTESFDTVVVFRNLIGNGGFDIYYDPAPWVFEGDFYSIGSTVAISPYRVGAGGIVSSSLPYGKNNATGRVYQDVTIPSDATIADLVFWYNITTDFPSPSKDDFLQVNLRDTGDVFITNLLTLDNTDQAPLGSWSQVAQNIISYKGQPIRIEFLVSTDGADPTVFHLEDVSLLTDGN